MLLVLVTASRRNAVCDDSVFRKLATIIRWLVEDRPPLRKWATKLWLLLILVDSLVVTFLAGVVLVRV